MKKQDFFLRTKARAILYIIIPVVISFTIIYIILFLSLFNLQQNKVRAEFQNIAGKHTSTFDNKINNAIDYLRFVVSVLEFQIKEGTTDRAVLQRMLYSIFENHPNIDGSSIYFEPNMYDGRDADFTGTNYGTNLSGRICYYYYHSNDGIIYKPEALENDIEFSKPHYTDVKTLNVPIYTNPEIFEIDGNEISMFIIVYPIRNSNNEFIGAITADIYLEEFYAQLQSEKIFETGYIIITNDREVVIYSPRYEDIGRTREEAGLNRAVPIRPNTAVNVQDEETEVVFVKSVFDNKNTLLSRKTIHIHELNGHFYFSVAAPLSEINANEIGLAFGITSISVIILILVTMILYFIIDKLTKPLGDISKFAENIAQGNYSIRLNANYRDEFAVLKDTLNFMSERIEQHMEDSKRSQNVLKNILNGIDTFVYVSVPDTGELLFINEQLKKLFNITNDDYIGQRCYKLFRNLDNICENCPCCELDKDPDKTLVWEEHDSIVNRDIRHADRYINWPGGIKAHLQYSIDITDIKRITAEKIKAENEAVDLAREKNQAEETSRMKSIFLASMSHEIRTPMHGIIGFSELALDDDVPIKTRSYLSKIKTSAESLLMIINDILDVSKIEARKMELERIPFDVSEVFKLCRIIASPKAREKGLTLFCYAEPSVGRMMLGDPTRLRQILLNLLSNAIKFTNNGMVKLLSAITEKTNDYVIMHFEVKDSGIGMTEEQKKHIFQPFTQADSSTTRKFGGTGLGLTISKSFIELMGGTLEVESNFGLGSKFSFDIKFDTVDKSIEISQIPAVVNLDEKPLFEGDVLVCEDNHLNQMVISDHLSKVGLNTLIAANGKIGVNYIRKRIENNEKPFVLIFMDIHMPEMDGLEAAKKIMEMGCKTPIVALTANIMTTDKETYFKSGMCDCLPKPFVAHDLWICLLKFIKPVSMLPIKQEIDYTEEEEQNMELITAFIKSNQSTISDIKTAVNTGDIKLAHRLAHTLKGVAGLVGRIELADAAQIVEHSLSADKTESIGEKIKNLEIELNTAISEFMPIMDNYMGKVVEKQTEDFYEKEKSLELLENLDSYLESDSIDSLDFINDLRMIPGTEQLASQVENMKFKQARETLKEIKRKITDMNQTETGNELP
ncbi:MAG: ATP-binding protein [Treponema sp.]|nr:ATP-binding protein [Treponema sp.]